MKPFTAGISSLRFLGFAGITFIFTMLTSDGEALKVWLLTFGMTVFLLTNMLAVTSSVSQADVDYAKTLRMSKPAIVYEVLVRGKLADFLDLVRQNAAIGWTLLSMVEGLVRSDGGIGSLLLNQNKHLHLAGIFAIQLTILAYGLLQDYLLGLLRTAVCPYVKFIEVKKG
jgi:NitT/TauT family transport system permease protein